VSRNQGILFILPAMIVLALLVAYPIVYIRLPERHRQPGRLVGLKNFAAMARRAVTRQAVWNTLYYVLGSIILQVTLGTSSASAQPEIPRPRHRARGGADPVVVPGIVAATTWPGCSTPSSGSSTTCSPRVARDDAPVGWLTDRDKVMPAMIAI